MTTIKLRRDTAANWTSVNPILAEGEVGIETDTNQQKIGDGITAWNKLPYLINYDSFDAPMVDYVAQTGTTWDETKLNYNSSSKVFTPMDTTANRNVYPITFIVPNNVNIDAYSTIWKFYIPNNNIFATVGEGIDNCCCEIYAEGGQIAQLWYSANSWRRGDYSGGRTLGLNIYNNVPWDIRHYPANSTSTYVETIGGQSLSDGFTFNSSSGRLTKIVIYVNSQMNQNRAVGDVRLCLLDSGGNIAEEYPLFTEGSQPRVKLNYNTNNLTINASGQLDTTSDLSSFLTSITSSDVITALGYTPVNKAGDTMTGNLTVPQIIAGANQSINIGADNRINLIMPFVSKGSSPSSQQYQGVQFNDGDSNHTTWQSKRLSGIEASVTDTGESKITITAYKNEADSTSRASFTIGYTSSPYCTFPNTTCVDGQWVSKSLSAWSSATLPTTDPLELDLRDAENPYLPTDDDYEIIVDAIAYTSGSVVDAPSIVALYGGRFTERIIAVKTLNANQSNRQAGMAIIPITKTFHKLRVNADANNLGSFSLQIRGYRRTGTNT